MIRTPIPNSSPRPNYPRPTAADIRRGLELDIEARIAEAQRIAESSEPQPQRRIDAVPFFDY